MSDSEEKTQSVVESKDDVESKVPVSDDNDNASSNSDGRPSTAYLNLCAQHGAAIRPYLMATLKEIAAEMEGQQRAGVIQLRGSLKVSHASTLQQQTIPNSTLRECGRLQHHIVGFLLRRRCSKVGSKMKM